MERQGYSVLSIFSFIFSILGLIFFLLIWITVGASASDEVVGAMAFSQFFMNLIGGASGITSLFSNSNKRVFGILGTILSSATFIITLSILIVGFAMTP
tara:strand:+ start:163 stop:459 length:297 start_codon:yes stop_codon:yes gene_type:complete